jgi:hypothetical protein
VAFGEVWTPPYRSVIGLLTVITDRVRWHYFHGWLLDRGLHVDELTSVEFLDIAHRYLLLTTEDKDNAHSKLEQILLGPLATLGKNVSLVDERTGIVPPAWWHGDDEAYRNSMAAMQGMRR